MHHCTHYITKAQDGKFEVKMKSFIGFATECSKAKKVSLPGR